MSVRHNHAFCPAFSHYYADRTPWHPAGSWQVIARALSAQIEALEQQRGDRPTTG